MENSIWFLQAEQWGLEAYVCDDRKCPLIIFRWTFASLSMPCKSVSGHYHLSPWLCLQSLVCSWIKILGLHQTSISESLGTTFRAAQSFYFTLSVTSEGFSIALWLEVVISISFFLSLMFQKSNANCFLFLLWLWWIATNYLYVIDIKPMAYSRDKKTKTHNLLWYQTTFWLR